MLRPAIALALTLLAAPSAMAAQAATLFRQVRLFDGTRVVGVRDVLVRAGKIAAVAARIAPPAGAAVVDGAGKTLLPGLIDAHVHAWADAPRTALVFGVTTELDMFTAFAQAATWRAEQRGGKAAARADVLSAGTLVTAPKGHGTEYGMPIPTIESPDSAQAFVDARIAEGSDYIKIVYDDGHSMGGRIPTLSEPTMRAVIAAAHRRGKLAVVHIHDLQSAREAIAAGADGLVHLFVDRAPDVEFGRFVARHDAFVVPTLTVLQSVGGVASGASLVADARLAAYLPAADAQALRQGFPRRPNAPEVRYAAAEETVRQLRAAGVPVLAGTDAGNPGTSHGASIHRELELLVQAGLTPSEALASATSVPARAFRLADRGRVAPGLRADLLLVDGDPTTDITATRAIAGVWKEGVALDRAAAAERVAAQREAAARAPTGAQAAIVSDFEGATPTSSYGAGWDVSVDAVRGGKSTGRIALVPDGANGSRQSLAVSGAVDASIANPWAGAMFSPGERQFQPANLSSKKEIRFWARGDGRTYALLLFAQSRGYAPLVRPFVAGPEWREQVVTFAELGTDGRDIMGLIFAASGQPGPFSFRIDDVRIE
jgi:imidazolonepropionase-like amidohydrolase